jgi:hypothetical protein
MNGLHAMSRLSGQIAPVVDRILHAAMMTAVAIGVVIHRLTDLGMIFLRQWFSAWCIASLAKLPISALARPTDQRFASVLAPGGSRH